MKPRLNFRVAPLTERQSDGSLSIELADLHFGMWSSFAVEELGGTLSGTVEMAAGDEQWAIFGLNQQPVQQGAKQEVGNYLDWLSHRESLTDAPLQVMYHTDGRPRAPRQEMPDLRGYRQSRPVSLGNPVYTQKQHGAVGYLADCTLIFLENGGVWRREYWDLIRRVTDHTVKIWKDPDNGIWELAEPVHWVSSKVMSWVVLDRAIPIAEKVGRAADALGWKPIREEIRREVLERGWNEGGHSFRQHYGNDQVDGALLLIPVIEFLPPDDPRVVATVARIERELTIEGFVYRFKPETTPGIDSDLPVGVFECAFFPTTFWLATTYAEAGKTERAEAILDHCQKLAGELGIFAEGVDAGSGEFRGNTPLLFSQVEYARARLAIDHYRSLQGGEPASIRNDRWRWTRYE